MMIFIAEKTKHAAETKEQIHLIIRAAELRVQKHKSGVVCVYFLCFGEAPSNAESGMHLPPIFAFALPPRHRSVRVEVDNGSLPVCVERVFFLPPFACSLLEPKQPVLLIHIDDT